MSTPGGKADATLAVIIATRFSILSHVQSHSWARYRKRYRQRLRSLISGGRKIEPTMEEKRAYLFDPARLRYRLWTFETFVLNSLANQTDRNFRHIVLTSDELPQGVRADLNRLSHSFGFEIWEVGLRTNVADLLEERLCVEPAEADFVATMRLDDDDALGREAVSTLRSLMPLPMDDCIVTWPNGMYLVDHGEGRFGFERLTRRDPPSCGLTRVSRTSTDWSTVYSAGNHRKVDEKFKVLSLPQRDAWLMTNHHDNVSRRSAGEGERKLDDETRRLIAERFGVMI